MSESNQKLTQDFFLHFQTTRSELTSRLEGLESSLATSNALEQISRDVAKLRKELTDATSFLPSYDQRQCELRLKETESLLENLRASAAPKPKFSFKRKANPVSTTSIVPLATLPPNHSATVSAPSLVSDVVTEVTRASNLALMGHSHHYLTLSSLPPMRAAQASDLAISDLDHCIVNLLRSPKDSGAAASSSQFTALHARNIRDSVLILPHIDGSVLLHDLTRCVIILGCHQFRMHTSSDVDVYLAVSSKPIIEHCKNTRFTHYPSHLHSSDQSTAESKHTAVQDFSHIRATPSPNWLVLPDDRRIPDSEWPVNPVNGQDDLETLLHTLLPNA
ncbi:TBCC-domain-containing protein [Obba rivulosa]|uniref:TBCC-domain-containing protein n=1 Tax=Obba rivulosa TaxID=1052685 RepID=A0A8E2J4Q9_9APHY|nr:TBCC-domain-containing protein [Obba rivulosa]